MLVKKEILCTGGSGVHRGRVTAPGHEIRHARDRAFVRYGRIATKRRRSRESGIGYKRRIGASPYTSAYPPAPEMWVRYRSQFESRDQCGRVRFLRFLPLNPQERMLVAAALTSVIDPKRKYGFRGNGTTVYLWGQMFTVGSSVLRKANIFRRCTESSIFPFKAITLLGKIFAGSLKKLSSDLPVHTKLASFTPCE